MPKRRKSRRHNNRNDFTGDVLSALDMMLSGYDKVIGPDFILTNNDPLNADYGYLNPEDLRRYDQKYVDTLISLKPKTKVIIPDNLEALLKEYTKQRELLSELHNKTELLIIDNDVAAAKELKNYDDYGKAVVIRNDAEFNVFCDYILLYRKVGNKRTLVNWLKNTKEVINLKNKAVINSFENARFSILRIDKNLQHGAIKVINIATKEEMLLIDNALNRSKMEGSFFICSLLNMGKYVMTSGGGVPIDASSPGGKSILTLSKGYLNDIKNANNLSDNLIECIRKIYGTAIRGRALANMTVNPM